MKNIKNIIVKHKKIFIIVFIIIILFMIILSYYIKEKEETKMRIIDLQNDVSEIEKWYEEEDAVENVRVIMNNLYNFKKAEKSYYQKKLSGDEIEKILIQYYYSLTEFDLEKEEVDKLLIMFFEENNNEKFNNFDDYTQYLGEKAYYKYNNKYNQCGAYFYTSIFDDYITLEKRNFFKDKDDFLSHLEYKIILKDKNYKILDIIEVDDIEFNNNNFEENIKIDIKNVNEIDYYIISCM